MKILLSIKILFIIVDTSIKNNIAFLISHIHRGQEIIAESTHHVTNVTSTKAELFTIKCGINHAMQLQNIH